MFIPVNPSNPCHLWSIHLKQIDLHDRHQTAPLRDSRKIVEFNDFYVRILISLKSVVSRPTRIDGKISNNRIPNIANRQEQSVETTRENSI